MSTVLPAKKPVTNGNLIFFQLQEKTAGAYINQILSNLAGMNAFKLIKPPKNPENTQVDNESVLKTYVSAINGNDTHAKGYNLLGGVNKFMIVKDHIYFNFTKYGIAEPSWVTVVRHPIDQLYALYGMCLNGTIKNPDFKGSVCNKKFRMTGSESFDENVDVCVKNAEKQMDILTASDTVEERTAERDPEKSDCLSDKIYSILRYSCGQTSDCTKRFSVLKKERKLMLELTKRRMLFDYDAIGLFEELELSFSLFQKMFPNYFSSVNDLQYGQRSIGPRRFELMNKLWGIRWSSHSLHPRYPEWKKETVEVLKKWLSYELDAYYFAGKLFWDKIRAYKVQRYVPKEDTSADLDIESYNKYGEMEEDDMINTFLDIFRENREVLYKRLTKKEENESKNEEIQNDNINVQNRYFQYGYQNSQYQQQQYQYQQQQMLYNQQIMQQQQMMQQQQLMQQQQQMMLAQQMQRREYL